MDTQQIIYRVGELGVRSERIQSDVKPFINMAQRTIAERCNWQFMHNRIQVTMNTNTLSATLPENFKGLSPERSPVSYNQPTSGFPIPVDVMSREQVERVGYGWKGWYTLVPNGYLPVGCVFFEQDAGGLWTINIPSYFQNNTAITYNVSGYFYPADLVKGTDTNGITVDGNLGEALVNLTVAMLHEAEDPTDPRAKACRQQYERYIGIASNTDARRRLVGRRLHM